MEEKAFVNRQEELKQLVSALSRKGPELIILYGRRRVGKSRLLREVCKKAKVDVFVMLEEADYNTNLRKVSEAVVKRFGFPSFSPASFKDLFSSLPDGTLIFLDEYSYLPGSIGEFQAIWEDIVKPKGIKLVLSGSLIRVMEDLSYSLSSPLYGRATQIIKLTPLSLQHVLEWYGKNAKIEKVLPTYFCVGGVPRYLEVIERPSLAQVQHAFLSKNGLLLREGKLLLKESFPTSLVFPKILFTVSCGVSEATKIANAVQIKANEVSKYLMLLSDYGFVEKRYPSLGGGKKDVRFYTADRFLSFWTKFVWPYYDEIENSSENQATAKFKKNFTTFAGLEFEKTIIEILKQRPRLIPLSSNNAGKQWGRIPGAREGENQYEIDVCATDEKNNKIFFAECKWKEKVNAQDVIKNLNEKTAFVDWRKNKRREILAVFAKSFKSKITEYEGKKVLCFDLNDLEQTLKNS
ncbi:ATP-binding protein [Candidatus Micrarchaeota archaeon]|nr:ATP-binding protein [Candidatus Micrarchaeota archaeon]